MSTSSSPEQYARINPDSKPVLYLVLTVTTVIAAVAFTVSFAGLAAVSQWAQIPPRLSWALPVFIDGAILGFTIMILVFRARGESTLFAWVVLIAFTIISVGANGAHAYAEGAPEDWRTIVGSGLAGLAPAGLAVFIHGIARLLVAPPQRDVDTQDEVGNLESWAAEGGLRGADEDDIALLTSDGGQEAAAELNGRLRGVPSTPDRREEFVSSHERAQTPLISRRSGLEEPVGQTLGAADESMRATAAGPRLGQAGAAREVLVERAIELYGEGKSQREISEELEVPQSTVGRWIRQHKQDLAKSEHLRKSTNLNGEATRAPVEV